jgi:phage portal protein BeeE
MDPAEKRQIQKDWIKRNADQIVITESNVDWTPMSYPTKQLMLFEELDADKMAIIDAYGLSQYLFASTKGATFTNVFEGMRMTYQDTIIPETDQLYATLSHQLGLTDQGLKLCADFSHVAVLQKDQVMQSDAMDKRANAVLKIIESGVELSDDEKRALLGINNTGY